MDLNATLNITDDTLTMKVHNADLSFNGPATNSTIGPVNTGVLNAMVGLFETIIVGVINIITYDIGINLNNTLKKLGITFIKFGKTTLTP